jgi:fatty acid desaturase
MQIDARPFKSHRHAYRTTRVIAETTFIFIGLAIIANQLGPVATQSWMTILGFGVVLLAQGLTLQRIYHIAHEGTHKRLAPQSVVLNDFIGQAVLLPMLAPLQVLRAIHNFHHGFSRRDIHTSALDVFVSPIPVTLPVRAFCFLIWYLAVFAGGWFLYSLVSIVLFLFMPISLARKISPAFNKWTWRDQLIAWEQFLACAVFHALVAFAFGIPGWWYTLGLPMLSFAWVYSLLVYIFHYRTTMGTRTRYNARTIPVNRFTAWWLMNFNEHATHHMYPNVPWYALPAKRESQPTAYAERNQTVPSIWHAILNQLRGPIIVYAHDENPAPQFIMPTED